MKLLIAIFLFPIAAVALEFSGSFEQGGYIIGNLQKGATLTLNGKSVAVGKNGSFVFGLSRDFPPQANVRVGMPNGGGIIKTFDVKQKKWPTQHIKGVPKSTVNPDKIQLKIAQIDSQNIKTARTIFTDNSNFKQCCKLPVKDKFTGFYGSRRTYDGQEKSWHKGLDIAAPTGAKVTPAAAGTVVFAQNTFFNGNLVIIDHGLQLFSIYAHLNEIMVEKGVKITPYQPLGTVGSTGRSTGPHLHWGIYWKNVPLNPILWLKE